MQIGDEENRHPLDVMFDLAIATNLKAEFLGPNKGFNADYMAEIFNASQYTFPGVSDGGAHTKFFTGGAFTTDFLKWLVRDEQKITLEEAHYRHVGAARACGRLPRSRDAARGRWRPTWWSTTSTALMSSPTGSARSPMISPVANGGGCNVRGAIARSSSMVTRPSPKGSAQARLRANCSVTVSGLRRPASVHQPLLAA